MSRGNSGCAALVVIAVLVIVGLGYFGIHYEYGTEKTVTFTVSALDDQANGSNGHKYLIFTSDGQEYENTDAWLHGKTDSSNIWAKMLEAGKGATWKCKIYGYRNTVLSSYPDILDGCALISAGSPIPVT